MQTYEVKTIRDYSIALQDIILNHHVGVIQADIPGYGTGCFMHYTVPMPDVTLIYSLQHGFNSLQECIMLPIETLLTRFSFNGVYANGIIYNPRYNLLPYPYQNTKSADTGCLTIVHTNKLLPDLIQKVDAYIWKKIKTIYPTHDMIPSKYWYDCEELVKEIAMKCVLADKTVDDQKEPQTNPKLEELRTLIQYHQATLLHKEDAFIQKIAEKIFSNEAVAKKYICRLSKEYQVIEAIKEFKANENPEDTLYKKMRNLVDTFIKDNPETKNLKFIVKGRNDLITGYFKRKHPDFSIDNTPIELTLETCRFHNYEYTRKFNSWNFSIVKPKVKQQYNNRNEDYLNDFLPSDIISISYGRKIIYQAEP